MHAFVRGWARFAAERYQLEQECQRDPFAVAQPFFTMSSSESLRANGTTIQSIGASQLSITIERMIQLINQASSQCNLLASNYPGYLTGHTISWQSYLSQDQTGTDLF